jgi:hypothetical protein
MMTRNPFQRCLRSLLTTAGMLIATACSSWAATSVSQHGITWTFDKDYPSGRFANGDYWVVGPVKIVSITPRSTTSSGRTINGSMVNPRIQKMQGYDSACYGSNNHAYDPALNVALGVSASKPLTLPAGSSLVSTISEPTLGARPQLRAAAVLTVLANAPAAGSFRPPYVGTDKTIRWNKSKLNYGILRSLPKVASTPTLANVEALFERPWIEQFTTWQGRYLHPILNQKDYGREMANDLAEGLLSLQLDYTNAQKERLYIRLVQYGIDVYGAALNGAVWVDDGGHNHGRKMPMILAGMALGDSNILARANARNHFIFQEDRQTWYVTSADVGRTLYTADGRPRLPYTSAHVGLAEWGEKHTAAPNRDGSNWNAYYRDIVGHSVLGHVLTARLLKAETHWAWPALFDYADRYWSIEKGTKTGGGNLIRPFVHAMWSAYRGSQPTTFTPGTTATNSWSSLSIPAQTGSFTVAWDSVPSMAKMDSVTGLSLGAPTSTDNLATSVRFAPTGVIQVRNGTSHTAMVNVPYTAGVTYRFVKTVDLATRRYSVTVTPKGGSTVQLASNYAFRNGHETAVKLDRLGFYAITGAHSVLNVSVQATTSTVLATATAPTSTSTTTTTSTSTSTSGSFTTSPGKWGSLPIGTRTGKFTVSFTVVPSAGDLSAEVGASLGAASGSDALAAGIRFSPSGVILARNSGLHTAAVPLTYRAGVSYRVDMTIDVTTRRYNVDVTPAGGAKVALARGYAFRHSQKDATRLDRLSGGASGGSITVSNVSAR